MPRKKPAVVTKRAPGYAPYVTAAAIEDAIASTEFIFRPPLTICVATLKNGFMVVGHTGSASAENFDEELGRRYSLVDAHRSIGLVLGYQLRDRLPQEAPAAETTGRHPP